MVLAMTLHPRMERVVFVSDFRLGGENQILQFKESVSGRGIRIGKAVQELGEKVECMGFCSAGVRHALYEELIQAGIASDFIETAGVQRMRLTIFDQKGNSKTSCVQQGAAVDSAAVEQLEVAYARNLAKMGEGDVVALGGSVPAGVRKEIYASLISMAKERKIRAVLAARGECLLQGLAAGPYAAIISLLDLEAAAKGKLSGKKQICRAARAALRSAKARYFCVATEERVFLIWEEETLCAPLKKGCCVWDGMAAGLTYAVQCGAEPRKLLQGVAAGGELLCKKAPVAQRELEMRMREIPVEKVEA